jgi:hypothetical protein
MILRRIIIDTSWLSKKKKNCLIVGGENLFIYSSPALLLCLIKSSIEHQNVEKISFRRIKVVKFYSYCFFLAAAVVAHISDP